MGIRLLVRKAPKSFPPMSTMKTIAEILTVTITASKKARQFILPTRIEKMSDRIAPTALAVTVTATEVWAGEPALPWELNGAIPGAE